MPCSFSITKALPSLQRGIPPLKPWNTIPFDHDF